MNDLLGSWTSTEAIGNTILDWTALIKEGQGVLKLDFLPDGIFHFKLIQITKDNEQQLTEKDITLTLKHSPPPKGKYQIDTKTGRLYVEGDVSDLEWSYMKEDEKTLRLRLVGAKKFGRCKGVDNIYLTKSVSTMNK